MTSIETVQSERGFTTMVREKRGDRDLAVKIIHPSPTPPKESVELAKRSIDQMFALDSSR